MSGDERLRVAADALSRPIHTAGGEVPFGELTLADVQARAAELRSATGWGPTARVGGVARAWLELAATMQAAGARRVGELSAETTGELAPRLWVVPPRGSLL